MTELLDVADVLGWAEDPGPYDRLGNGDDPAGVRHRGRALQLQARPVRELDVVLDVRNRRYEIDPELAV